MLRFLHILTWLYFAAITILLLSPGVPRVRLFGEFVDDYTHFILFTLMGLLFEAGRKKMRFEFWLIFLSFYSLVSELLQGALSPWFNRSCDMQDLVQDLAGITAGMILARISVGALFRFLSQFKENSNDK